MVQVKKAAVREAILAAAVRLFSQRGYNGTTVTHIATAAGISTANLYVYFDSKLAILYTIYEPWLRKRLDQLERDLESIDDPRRRLRHIISVLWREIPAEENRFANNIIQAVSGTGPNEGYDPTLLRWSETKLASLLRRSVPRNDGRRIDAKALSHIIFMAFDGFAINLHVDPHSACSNTVINAFCNAVLGSELPRARQNAGRPSRVRKRGSLQRSARLS